MQDTRHVLTIELHSAARTGPQRDTEASRNILKARLALDNDPINHECIVSTASWAKLVADLTWYLEDYIYDDPFADSRAVRIEEKLREACRNLAVDLQLDKALQEASLEYACSVDLRIVDAITKDDSLRALALGFPWEALEQTHIWTSSSKMVVVSRYSNTRKLQHPLSTGTKGITTVNILLVLARALDSDASRPRDISPFLALEVITRVSELINKYARGVKVSIDIARPGTWAAVKECLRSRAKGYYHLVHFDVHGGTRKVGSDQTFASLSFASSTSPGKLEKKAVRSVASALEKAGVHAVVLNSCNSASNTNGFEENASLILQAHGVHTVVGMSYKASAEAMDLFLLEFYAALLTGSSFAIATHKGRTVLAKSDVRTAKYQLLRVLKDFILPVIHLQGEQVLIPNMKRFYAELTLRELAKSDDARTDYMLGRDFDVLRLEVQLLTSRVVLLHGSVGVGKTTVLKRAVSVWQQSGYFDACIVLDLAYHVSSYQDFISTVCHQLEIHGVIARGSATNEDTIQAGLCYKKVLLTVDNIEDAYMAHSPSNERTPLSPVEWSQILELISILVDHIDNSADGSRVLLISRTLGAYDDMFTKAPAFDLEGLHLIDSRAMLAQQLAKMGRPPQGLSGKDRIAIDCLLDLLKHNPTAIQLVSQWTSSTGADLQEFLNGLVDWSIDPFDMGLQSKLHFDISNKTLQETYFHFSLLEPTAKKVWLTMAVFWHYGPHFTGLRSLNGATNELTDNSIFRAIKIAESLGYLLYDETSGSISQVSPLWTLCLRHGLKCLINPPEEDIDDAYVGAEYQSTNKDLNSLFLLHEIFNTFNSFKFSIPNQLLSFMPTIGLQMVHKVQYERRDWWIEEFVYAIIQLQEPLDMPNIGSTAARSMYYNCLLLCQILENTSMRLEEVPFDALLTFWRLARPSLTSQEVKIWAWRLSSLIESLLPKFEGTGVACEVFEAAAFLAFLPVGDMALSFETISPPYDKLANQVERLKQAYDSEAERPPSQLLDICLVSVRIHMGGDDDDAGLISEHLESLNKISSWLSSKGHDKSPQLENGWTDMFEALTKELDPSTPHLKQWQEKWKEVTANGIFRADAFSMSQIRQELENARNPGQWSETLDHALATSDVARACRMLVSMIQKAVREDEPYKARRLMNQLHALQAEAHNASHVPVNQMTVLEARVDFREKLRKWLLEENSAEVLAEATEKLLSLDPQFVPEVINPLKDTPKNCAGEVDATGTNVMLSDTSSNDVKHNARELFLAAMDLISKQPLVRGEKPEVQIKAFLEMMPYLSNLYGFMGKPEKAEYLTSIVQGFSECKEWEKLVTEGKYRQACKMLQRFTEAQLAFGRFLKADMPSLKTSLQNENFPAAKFLNSDGLENKHAHFNVLVDIAGRAFDDRQYDVAGDIWQQALDFMSFAHDLSISEWPDGLKASLTRVESYCIEMSILIPAMGGRLLEAAARCHDMIHFLTMKSVDDPRKMEWYRDVQARMLILHHARVWRILMDLLRPNEASLRLNAMKTAVDNGLNASFDVERYELFKSLLIPSMSLMTLGQQTLLKSHFANPKNFTIDMMKKMIPRTDLDYVMFVDIKPDVILYCGDGTYTTGPRTDLNDLD